ncbi:hypothetical protein QJS04_geneDACA012245 [Acorus gramineus]|uniref:Molybdate-anion transporter-like n=1 Tax=Acorus gramineus TaxID=55184 RepID=A0AAV9BCF7_ACOGR|nr:hypothetical protein QJS04_geneDACA012245 [Acorus gramineus]
MAIVIVTDTWEPKPVLYLFIFFSSFLSLFLAPYFSKSASKTLSLFDAGSVSPSFLRFQRSFLFAYSLASVIEGLGSVFGDFEYVQHGIGREAMALSLSVGSAASLFVGSFLGILFDVIGQRKSCMFFYALHLFVGIMKGVTNTRNSWTNISLALASSSLSFSFEAWMVHEHEKLGFRQDLLNTTFWLMTFFGSASLIGSQMLANLLMRNAEKGIVHISLSAALLAMISIIYIRSSWSGGQLASTIGNYRAAFSALILSDKKIWLLAWAQTCLHFSVVIFWTLWAPTIVADGREVHLAMLYPSFLGSQMLGSTIVPWLLIGPLSMYMEDCLAYAFVTAGVALSVVAYDYQEVGFLVAIFCVFHACIGMAFPSLARLRTMYVPNEFRGGMISLSLGPANAAILLVLIQGGYYRNLENSMILAMAAFGLFSAGICIYYLKKWSKQPQRCWHKS